MENEEFKSDDQCLQQAESNMAVLDKWLSSLTAYASESDDKWLITSILKCARRYYLHLMRGRDEDTSYVAWASRGLLELQVIARYVATTSESRTRFIHDFFIDIDESTLAQKKLASQVDPKSIPDHDALLKSISERKTKRGFKETKYLKTRDLAKATGLEETYERMNKICSKLVHPTALSVLSIGLEDAAQRAVLVISGCNSIADLIDDLAPLMQLMIGKKQ